MAQGFHASLHFHWKCNIISCGNCLTSGDGVKAERFGFAICRIMQFLRTPVEDFQIPGWRADGEGFRMLAGLSEWIRDGEGDCE
ncbi:uncharacterized [Tachysurus ichikawai]